MTFNVRGDYDDGENGWEFRSALNISTIEKYAPDLIGFQEIQMVHWKIYEEELLNYQRNLGPRYDSCHLSIFWNPSRFEIVDGGRFWLSTTPERASSAWNTACMRAANWVKLRLKSPTRSTLIFLNTHLDHVSGLARLEGARLITRMIEEIREPGQPAIITGDFNCDPGSEVHRYFLDAGYVDSYLKSGNEDGENAYTFHKFTGSRQQNQGRIDWILIASDPPLICPLNSEIIRDARGSLYPSDHYPVIVDLKLNAV